MGVVLRGYEMNGPTWFYLSFLLIVAVYFRFSRIFSLRNFDLAILLSASPGLLFVSQAESHLQSVGYAWLFVIAIISLIRLFIDPLLNRRPYLGQNLNSQGMVFLCVCAFIMLTTKAITDAIPPATHQTVQLADDLIKGMATDEEMTKEAVNAGPAATLIAAPIGLVFETLAARILAVLAHAAVVVGLWFVGRNLFADNTLGISMATLYLLLPCTAYNVGEFNHVLPAALIVWAFVSYRKPLVSGTLLGLACGTMFFPIVLFPIWAAYYGRRGAGRFATALVGVAIVLLATIALTTIDSGSFVRTTIGTINIALTAVTQEEYIGGFWRDVGYLSFYRWPVMALYLIMIVSFTLWPKKRNVEVLLAQSAAAIVGTQLWYTQNGGVYLLWYVPLLLMVIFRPRLLRLKGFDEEVALNEDAARPSRTSVDSNSSRTPHRLQLFR